MKPKTTRGWLPALLGILTSSQIPAQSVAAGSASGLNAPAPQEAIELSPFVVSASDDAGYRAKTALEGGRMRTNLADISNPIDVITAEVISDMGATGLDNLFTVVNSIEMPADMVFNTTYDTGNAYQVRGFGGNVTTRNFAPGTTPFEAYNTTRLTAAMGPNAILFGNGPGGGSLGYMTKQANLNARDGTQLQLRTDNHGSLRGTLSLDQILTKGKLGLHLDLLEDDARFAIKPSYHRKNGVTFSAGWQPFKNTSVHVSFERRREDSHEPSVGYWNVVGNYQAWDNAAANYNGVLPAVLSAVSATGNRATVNVAGVSTPNALITAYGLTTQTTQRLTLIDGHIVNEIQTALTNRPTVPYTLGTNVAFLLPASVLPRNLNTPGYNHGAELKFDVADINIEQKVSDNLYLMLALGKNDSKRAQYESKARALYREANYYGKDGVTRNPHFGQYYVENYPNYLDRRFTDDSLTLTTSYELNAAKKSKWLGRHNLLGLYSYVESANYIYRGVSALLAAPAGPSSATTSYTNTANQLFTRDYLNPPSGEAASADYRYIRDQGLAVDGYRFGTVYGNGAPDVNGRKITSLMFASQSHFWNNRWLVNYGYRKEKVNLYTRYYAVNNALNGLTTFYAPMTKTQATDPDYLKTATLTNAAKVDDVFAGNVVDDSVRGMSRNIGVILKVTNNIALVANRSSNINASATRIGILGTQLPVKSGESTDLGIRFDFWNGKLRVEYTNYTTAATNSDTNATASTGLREPLADAMNISATLLQYKVISVDQLANGQAWDTKDQKGQGHELTINASPTPEISFRLAASQNLKNINTNIGPEFRGWWAANKDVIARFASTNPNAIDATSVSTQTFAAHYADVLTGLTSMDSIEGQQGPDLSNLSLKFIGKYVFREGALKGLEAGANVAWWSKQISAYWQRADRTLDYSRPLYTKAYMLVNPFVSYSRGITVGSHKASWKVQLNVNNVLEKGDIWTGLYNTEASDGSLVLAKSLRRINPREFVVTNTLAF